MKKFAFILMGGGFNPEEHKAEFKIGNSLTCIFTVRNFQEACDKVCALKAEGFGAIELCGAFGEEKAQQLIELTENQVAIGFVTHKEEQDELFNRFFS